MKEKKKSCVRDHYKLYEEKLYPTRYTLDLWLTNDRRDLADAFNKRYGASKEYYMDELANTDFAATISPANLAEIKETRLVCVIENYHNMRTIEHEAAHLVFKLFDVVGQQVCDEIQEMFAIYLEYICDRIRECILDFTRVRMK
jgi:hypothetical protein